MPPFVKKLVCLLALTLALGVPIPAAAQDDAAPPPAPPAAPATTTPGAPADPNPDAAPPPTAEPGSTLTVEDPRSVTITVEGAGVTAAATQPNDADADEEKPAKDLNADQKLVESIREAKAKAEAEEAVNSEPKGPLGKIALKNTPQTGITWLDVMVRKLTKAVVDLIDATIAALPNLIIALLVLVVAAFVAALATRAIRKVASRSRLRGSLVNLFVIFGRVAVWFIAFMTAAGIIFPGFGFAQLVATAGLASIAIGFAFQDIFQNFFAGILILWSFPFENGDFIEVEGLMGRVEDVEIRMTKIRQTNGELVLVPNSTIFTNKVTVMTNRPHRRLLLTVGVAYGEDVAKARKVITEAVRGCNTVERDASPEVLATAFGASSIDFDVIWWADSKPLQARRSRDQVVEAIKKALDDANIEIPYPYRTLTFSKNEPDIIHAVAGRMRGMTGGDDEV